MAESEIRHCEKHGDVIFHKWQNRWRCSKCAAEAVQKRRDLLKLKALEYKGGKCEICGYDKNYAALEFHHLDPNEKDFGIASDGYTRSWENTKEELDKCILVCANCHRELHNPTWNKEGFQDRLDSYKKKEILNIPSKEELEQRIYSGKTQKEIAEEYNVSISTLKRWYNQYSLKKENPIRPDKTKIEEDLKVYSVPQLAKIYNMSAKGLYKLCIKLNIDYRKNKAQ